MAVHEEPSGGEHGAPSPIACRSPCWRRGHLVTGEQHHPPWRCLVRPGDHWQPGQDRPDRCGDGIGSALAAVLGGPLVDRLGFAAVEVDRGNAPQHRGEPLITRTEEARGSNPLTSSHH